MSRFAETGWCRFGADPDIARWVDAALAPGRAALRDPALSQWHVCEGTWFVGVDALPNGPDGAIAGSGPLSGAVMRFLQAEFAEVPPLHHAQVSVVRPGYPRPREGESAASFRFRRDRDAAHVDGARPVGPDRRRHVLEPHAFILGLPLTRADPEAAPLVVWEGSHKLMAQAFQRAFSGTPVAQWPDVDVTDVYQSTRRTVFQTCRRVPVPAHPGEAVLVHRLALHGIAPWADGARADPDGRMVAYFRPELTGGIAGWPLI